MLLRGCALDCSTASIRRSIWLRMAALFTCTAVCATDVMSCIVAIAWPDGCRSVSCYVSLVEATCICGPLVGGICGPLVLVSAVVFLSLGLVGLSWRSTLVSYPSVSTRLIGSLMPDKQLAISLLSQLLAWRPSFYAHLVKLPSKRTRGGV